MSKCLPHIVQKRALGARMRREAFWARCKCNSCLVSWDLDTPQRGTEERQPENRRIPRIFGSGNVLHRGGAAAPTARPTHRTDTTPASASGRPARTHRCIRTECNVVHELSFPTLCDAPHLVGTEKRCAVLHRKCSTLRCALSRKRCGGGSCTGNFYNVLVLHSFVPTNVKIRKTSQQSCTAICAPQ